MPINWWSQAHFVGLIAPNFSARVSKSDINDAGPVELAAVDCMLAVVAAHSLAAAVGIELAAVAAGSLAVVPAVNSDHSQKS